MTISATYRVTGMTCGHCEHAVKSELGALDAGWAGPHDMGGAEIGGNEAGPR